MLRIGKSLTFRRLLVESLLACSMIIGFSGTAWADTIYSYTGPQFEWFGGIYSCPPECSVTGWFSVASPLPPYWDGGEIITPIAFSFTDGITTWNQSNSPGAYFQFWVNQFNDISYWLVDLNTPGNNNFPDSELFTYDYYNWGYHVTYDGSMYWERYDVWTGTAYVWNTGEWSRSSPTIPEPGTLVLLATGVLGILARRRK